MFKLKSSGGTSAILKRMFLMAFYTTAIIEISQVGSSLIDGMITSRFLGTTEMAALGLATPYYSIAGVISGCISVGMQSMLTKEVGRGKLDNTKRIFGEAFIVASVLSLLVTAVLIIFANPIVRLLGARGSAEDLFELTKKALIGYAVGTPGFVLSAVIAPAVQLDNGNKLVQASAIGCAVSDILFDYYAAVSGMGLWGIAMATSVSNYVQLFILCWHFFKKDHIINPIITRVSLKDLKEMFILGLEKFTRRAVNVVRPILLNTLVIAVGGSTAMSVMSVRNSFNNFAEIPGAGIAGAVALMTGLFYGEINADDIKETGSLAHRYDIITSAITTVAIIVLAKPIAIFYLGRENSGLELLIFALRCLALRGFFATLSLSRVSYLRALHKVRSAQILTLMLNLIYIVACSYILSVPFGTYGIMAAYPVSEILVLITIYVKYAIKEKTLKPQMHAFLDLDESFNLGPGDVIDFPIRNKEEASLTAQQISLFCKGHKFDSKKSYFASLCAEEMATSIIEEGFSKKDSNTIDIRVVIRDGDMIIRMRDNCPDYSYLKKLKEIEESDDLISNAGIRLVSKLAKDISYYRTLETNTTIITI